MGRHKYTKRENDIAQNGEGLLDAAKNLTKKGAEAALKKGAVKLSEKAGRKLGEKVFRSSARASLSRAAVQPGKTSRQSSRVEDLSEAWYQSPENSGHEIFKILSSAAKQTSQKDSEEHKTNNQRPKPMSREAGQTRGLTQQEINENLNRLMNM